MSPNKELTLVFVRRFMHDLSLGHLLSRNFRLILSTKTTIYE